MYFPHSKMGKMSWDLPQDRQSFVRSTIRQVHAIGAETEKEDGDRHDVELFICHAPADSEEGLEAEYEKEKGSGRFFLER